MDNFSWRDLSKRSKILIISLLSIFILVPISIFVGMLIYRAGKTEVYIQYAPFISTVQINNKTYENNSHTYIAPGKYNVTVSLDGFDTLNTEVDITESTHNIFGMLNPNSEEGEKIKAQYINDYRIVEARYAERQAELGNLERAKWPIIKELPITNALFAIGYTLSDDKLTINISATETYLNSAINRLKSLEDSISQYDINLKNFTNNFSITPTPSTSKDPIKFIEQSYINAAQPFVVDTGENIDGYYITTLSTGKAEQYDLVTYRIILTPKDKSWRITSNPFPILTIHNTPNIDPKILDQANAL